MHSKQWHYSLLREFQNCYSTRRSPTGFFSSNSTILQFYKGTHPSTYTIHIYTCTSREFSIQNPILHAEDKELFEYYYYIQRAKRPSSRFQKRNSTHRRQGDLLEIHPCVLQDLPMASKTFQPFKAILHRSSMFRDSTPFQHSPIRMHILYILQFLQFDWFPQKLLQFDWFPQKLHRVPIGQLQTLHYRHYILQRKGDVVISVKRASVKDVKMTYFLE